MLFCVNTEKPVFGRLDMVPYPLHNFLQNQPILKVKKRLKTRVQELSPASKLVFVAQTVKKCQRIL